MRIYKFIVEDIPVYLVEETEEPLFAAALKTMQEDRIEALRQEVIKSKGYPTPSLESDLQDWLGIKGKHSLINARAANAIINSFSVPVEEVEF